MTSDGRLHLIYLINDILHNWYADNSIALFFASFSFDFSLRTGNETIRIELSKMIIPIYCYTIDQSDDERRQKLVKV